MIEKPFDQIERADVDALVSNEVAERRNLEYKELLPGGSNEQKTEFLADVSSFANAGGGDLLYGVQEKRDSSNKCTGIPLAAPGLTGISADSEIRRLENMLRDGVDPRIPGIQLKAVAGPELNPVILLRIPQSWAMPHMVRGSYRFYSRNSAGKYALDVREIRSAFALSEALPDRLRRFRDERLSKIVAGETPVPLADGARIVLHVVPIAAVDPTIRRDVTTCQLEMNDLRPMGSSKSILNHRMNFDGLLLSSRFERSEPNISYCQLFRNGSIESVRVQTSWKASGRKNLPIARIESEVAEALQRHLRAQSKLDLSLPAIVLLTLLGVKGYFLSDQDYDIATESQELDRDTLLLPDILVESERVEASNLLRSTFRIIWQAAGFSDNQT